MKWNSVLFSAAATIIFAFGPTPQTITVTHAFGCAAGDRIDGSNAADAKKKMKQAGFDQVHDLAKGCDNFWHAMAVKDGNESHVALTPQGQVMREGD